MKIKNKKLVVILSALFLIMISITAVYFASAEIKKSARETVVESFLTEAFTLNKDNRYYVFTQAVDNQSVEEKTSLTDISEAINEAQNLYMVKIAGFATRECVSSMVANRLPFKLDSLVTKENETLKPAELSYDEETENIYSFTVSYNQNQFTEKSFSGQVKLELVDNKYYVSSVFIQ